MPLGYRDLGCTFNTFLKRKPQSSNRPQCVFEVGLVFGDLFYLNHLYNLDILTGMSPRANTGVLVNVTAFNVVMTNC